MKVVMLVVVSSLFFTTLIFAGEGDNPPKFLDLKPTAPPAEKPREFTMPKEQCKNGLYYNSTFDKCVISSNTTSIERGKKEAEILKETKGAKQRSQIIEDAKKTGLGQ